MPVSALLICVASGATAQGPAEDRASGLPTIAERTAELAGRDGFFPLHYEDSTGRLFMEVPVDGSEFLSYASLSTGIAWPIERGELTPAASIARFERAGSRVLLVERNPTLRATGPDSARLAPVLDDIFSRSVSAVFGVVAEDQRRVLIDVTTHMLRDVFDISSHAVARRRLGSLSPDPGSSRILFDASWNGSRQTAVVAELDFAIEEPGPDLGLQDRTGETVSVRQVHHFVELPPPYEPRPADVRLGLQYQLIRGFDGTPSTDSRRRFVLRWRLKKQDPAADLSEPVRPVTFYLGGGIPAAYRQAFRDGILYWNRVFEAAGFRDAVRVEDLPGGVDPGDARYPIVVLWTPSIVGVASRAQFIADPRTGEMRKAIILINPHQFRAVYNKWMAMRPALAPGQPDAEAFVLAKAYFVLAHESGHVLAGISHNYVEPSQVGLPAAAVRATGDGVTLDLSTIVRARPTAFDEWLIRYAYTPFATPEAEREGLRRIVAEGRARGLGFAEDWSVDAFPGAAGRRTMDDPVLEMEAALRARRAMLARFSDAALAPGEDRIALVDRLVPLYFHHRYAIRALAKAVGGVEYTYGRRGDSLPSVRSVDPEMQRRALTAFVDALSPVALDIPPRVSGLIPPRAFAQSPSEFSLATDDADTYSYFSGESAPIRITLTRGGVFEPTDWARTLSGLIVDRVLERRRLARVVSLHAADPRIPSLSEVLGAFVEGTWGAPVETERRLAALQRVAERAVLDRLIALLADADATSDVRGGALEALVGLAEQLRDDATGDAVRRAHVKLALRDIERATR